MEEDYLWSGSGEPDPEIVTIESKLAHFRGNAPPLLNLRAAPESRSPWRSLFEASWPRLATASAILLVIAALIVERNQHSSLSDQRVHKAAAWNIENLAGDPRVANAETADAGKLGIGQTLETDAGSRARIVVDDLGQLEIGPNSRLRLLSSDPKKKWIALERGTINATIWAPAGEFVVDTPAATAVDLGCAYTLQVDDSGAGLIKTTMGWVGFKLDDREAFIPAGAACPLHAKSGPGTPYFEDSSARFRTALATFEDSDTSATSKRSALADVLGASRKRDALTLWHLFSRVNGEDRSAVFDRLASLVPPPAGVTRERVVALDQSALDQWWNAFGLGDISLFRAWERTWSRSPVANAR
jgi:hypothetical protein